MKKTAATMLLFSVVLASTIIGSVYSSVSIETTITRELHVVFQFTNIDANVYASLIGNQQIMNATSVPKAVLDNLRSKSIVLAGYSSASFDKNDTTRSIHSSFILNGQNIINSTVSRATSTETFTVNTAWRKFNLNLMNGFVYNFTQLLETPVAQWTKNTTSDGRTTYSYSSGEVVCEFSLPASATNVYVVGDTITFDLPYETPFEDKIINSPILILSVLAIVGFIIFLYRKAR